MSDSTKRSTRLLRTGRNDSGWVNAPVSRASTYVFDTVQQWRDTRKRRDVERLPSYGARGTDSTYALEDAVVELEGGHRGFLFPTGQAAIAVTLLAFLKPGDHILLSDASYEPVRNFCKHQLADLGISHSFYPPDGSGVEDLIQPNTKILYVECPGTITYDMLDLPRISEIARKHNLWLIADNTWGSGWLYQPLALGADISITAITKYIGGHSDLMMGASVANERAWPALQKATYGFGQTVGADDAFMALRGVRSMPLRLKTHGASALLVAQWLKSRPEIAHVFCPALPDDPGHALWKKHCNGTNGLVSFELKKQFSQSQAEGVIDALALFGLGASWGGFESLVIPTDLAGTRALTDWSKRGAVVRLHIGLEDTEDLIADLDQALNTLS